MKTNENHLIDRNALRQLREQHPELSELELAQILLAELKDELDCIAAEQREQIPVEGHPHPAATMSHQARGRRSRPLFHDEESALRVKKAIRQILHQHRNKQSDAIRIGTESYPTTDFLTAVYFALVEQGVAVGVVNDVAKRYYEFLHGVCLLDGLTSYRAFANRFKLVRHLGKEFHQLADEDFAKAEQMGCGMPAIRFPYWKAMVEAAEAVLDAQLS